MTDPVRIAVIGLGKIARDQHLPAIARNDDFQLVATVSHDGGGVAGLPFFATIDDLAASDVAVDAVALCTPPQARRAVAQVAIDRGWHVFLEKPPASTMAEAVMLRDSAVARGLSVLAGWHSRFAEQVEPARAWLAGRRLKTVAITWAEDVRQWHPGQDWIFEPGGLGVFDPAINALSIATRILPAPLFVDSAEVEVPANRAAPIAASVLLRDTCGIPISARFDFLQQGRQSWDIVVETEDGTLVLSGGGAAMSLDGVAVAPGATDLHGEYPALYRRFADIIRHRICDVDLAPLCLVADIFIKARMRTVAPFAW